MLLESADVRVHVPDVLTVDENEGILRIETYGDYVLNVLISQFCELSDVFPLSPEEVFLVICNLDHQWHIEGILQVLVEDERDHVTQVQCLT